MTPRVSVGDRVPEATLTRLMDDMAVGVSLHGLVAAKKVAIAGVPGAFTPVCSCRHVPDLLDNVQRLRGAGFDDVYVVAPNSPWVVAAWAHEIDPQNQLTFLSDGNLSLARALGVNITAHDWGLGETSARYLLVLENTMVRRLNVETHISRVDCTRARDAVFLD